MNRPSLRADASTRAYYYGWIDVRNAAVRGHWTASRINSEVALRLRAAEAPPSLFSPASPDSVDYAAGALAAARALAALANATPPFLGETNAAHAERLHERITALPVHPCPA